MSYLLDTSVIVDYFRGKEKEKNLLVSLLQENSSLFISIITYTELISGTYRAAHQEKEEIRVNGFIDDFQIQLIPLTKENIRVYSQIKIKLEKSGRRLDEFDLFIAASAIEANIPLITNDLKHFSRIPNLLLNPKVL